MKKISAFMLLAIMLVLPLGIKAQEKNIRITNFEKNYTSLIASMNPVRDNTGEVCAVLRIYVGGTGYTVVPNLGAKRVENLDGEIRLWVPTGTKRITVRHRNAKPLVGYNIPIKIDSKTDYDVDVKMVDVVTDVEVVNKGHNVYAGAGYNIMSISGPSLAIGAVFNHHNIELGAVYGINKTDDLYFYNSQGNVSAGYNYNAIRAQLRYGYEIPASDFFSITPQLGIAYNAYIGNEISKGNNSNYKNANALSALVALRFTAAINNRFKVCITPEYDVAVYKDDNCKLVSDYNDNFKNWHTGFNLNVGLMIFF